MRSVAYVVGTDDGPTTTLLEVARGIGFASTRPFINLFEVEQQMALTPICFFLFSQVPDVTMLRGIIAPLRAYTRRGVRFSPMVYFCSNPSRRAIEGCISMGFDDVISLPLSFAWVQKRLMRQIDEKITYFETADYFGPDPRMVGDPKFKLSQRHVHTGQAYKRHEIIRNMEKGISLIGSNVVHAA